MTLKGEFSGKIFKMGDLIKTKIKKVNVNEKVIDLEYNGNDIQVSEEDLELVREKKENERIERDFKDFKFKEKTRHKKRRRK
jgi:hypothetical protein